MEHHQIHRFYSNAIMLFQHIAIEVLLKAIMIENGIWKIDASLTHPAPESLYDGLSLGIHHLRTSLPVVDNKLPIGFFTN